MSIANLSGPVTTKPGFCGGCGWEHEHCTCADGPEAEEEHGHVSETTPDGHGAFCTTCGEPLA